MDLNAQKRAVVLLSGGLDSSTLLAKVVREMGAEQVIALSIFYGQKHDRELKATQDVASHYGVERKQLDLSALFGASDSSLLQHSSQEIPHNTYASQKRTSSQGLVSTYVPFRNGIFLSAAASMALSLGCGDLYYGAHRDDWADNVYPDCSREFVDAMGQAILEGSGGLVRLHAPFVEWSKAEIVKLGIELKVPFELTWSCYEGKERPCGVCGTCIDRARAFELNGVQDPLLSC